MKCDHCGSFNTCRAAEPGDLDGKAVKKGGKTGQGTAEEESGATGRGTAEEESGATVRGTEEEENGATRRRTAKKGGTTDHGTAEEENGATGGATGEENGTSIRETVEENGATGRGTAEEENGATGWVTAEERGTSGESGSSEGVRNKEARTREDVEGSTEGGMKTKGKEVWILPVPRAQVQIPLKVIQFPSENVVSYTVRSVGTIE